MAIKLHNIWSMNNKTDLNSFHCWPNQREKLANNLCDLSAQLVNLCKLNKWIIIIYSNCKWHLL